MTTIQNLNTGLLEHVKIDYVSVTCRDVSAATELLVQLKKIKSNLRVLDLSILKKRLDLGEVFSPNETLLLRNVPFRNKEERLNLDLKYVEKEYDVIFYDYFDQKNETKYARIPGSFAHDVFHAHFTKEIELDSTLFSISRFDFKFEVPGFSFKELDYERSLFLGFCEKQNLQRVVVDDEKGFFIGYAGLKRQRRMIRTYVTRKKREKTFEMECKRESAKRYNVEFFKRDLFGFNKVLVLECLTLFLGLQRSLYSKPLFEWFDATLKPLYNLHFARERYYKRQQKKILEQSNPIICGVGR